MTPSPGRVVRLAFGLLVAYAVYAAGILARALETVLKNATETLANASEPSSAKTWKKPTVASTVRDRKILHVGHFGLGHRLSKLTAAYDLADSLSKRTRQVIPLQVYWGTCGDDLELFEYLFGSSLLGPSGHGKTTPTQSFTSRKTVLLRNDVLGYYAGQNYKNARVALNDEILATWQRKLHRDVELFRQLVRDFRFRHEIEAFQVRSKWHDHHVIGVHLRLGNGELDHFVASSRNSALPTSEFLHNLSRSIHQYVLQQKISKPLVFVSTDTALAIPTLTEHLEAYSVAVVTAEQPRIEPGRGVSYQAWKLGESCRLGWKASTIDMLLLAYSDTLVATSRSTFTQILPRSLVQDNQKQFCEVNDAGIAWQCCNDETTWLLRNDASRVVDVAWLEVLDPSETATLVHKVMVHLPDVEPEPRLAEVELFVRYNDSDTRASADEVTLAYGSRINPKYRNSRNYTTAWTWR
jgi:hypothetical protein